jgi:hypothetical protein
MSMLLLEVIRSLVPNAEMAIIGEPNGAEGYADGVVWQDARPQPSWEDIEAARPAVEIAIANRNAQQMRQAAFQAEADPLFFAWQRGEGTEQAWLDKCAEIRDRYPYA